LEQPGARRARAFALGALGGGAALAALMGTLVGVPGPVASPSGRVAVAAEPKVVVEVRNGTRRAGLARQVTRLLREQGADVVYFGTASTLTDTTLILVRRGDLSRGDVVARMLGQGQVRFAPDSLRRVDVTVVLGADFRVPKGRFPL